MAEETITARLAALEKTIDHAIVTLDAIRNDLGISTRIEYANTRDIEKLKRHVAKLQHPDPKPPGRADDSDEVED